ncbi:hypothetical protein SBA5_70153 [Candidatus Sulfotelmatomonas gaucii]|uniref:Uncharacterized protein n=1 Tax=Candidatus Sulfuritelmatomonas gaucii TaxID=2043161 RepID=A0A2N9M0U6_9BACT|nr:hypothetical protein SBA5_70153 [Candidatus Sulfotelmatomonas gaucii]
MWLALLNIPAYPAYPQIPVTFGRDVMTTGGTSLSTSHLAPPTCELTIVALSTPTR